MILRGCEWENFGLQPWKSIRPRAAGTLDALTGGSRGRCIFLRRYFQRGTSPEKRMNSGKKTDWNHRHGRGF
jgi:hypothetical protein